jgi:cell division protein FtsW
MVFSASSIEAITEGSSPEVYLIKQLGFAAVGIIGAILLWKFIPYRVWLGPLVWILWGLSVFLIIMTAAVGSVGLGAQRWLVLGPISLQPSEFAKIAFLLMAANLLYKFRAGEYSKKAFIVLVGVCLILPLFFLYRFQSDLGTTIICTVGLLSVMWLGEVPWKIILTVVVAGVVLVFLASLVGYRSDRFVFLDPWSDYYGSGYQLIHGFYALSDGGIFGVGLGNSREKYLYLPEAETDFIFAIIGEELGLIGACAVIVLFLVFLNAGIRIARRAPDNFATMLAGGFSIMIVFQAFLNIACVLGLLPTTGKPLPFIAAGGSSLIASLFMVGIILSVSQGIKGGQKVSGSDIYGKRRADLRIVRTHEITRKKTGKQ